MNGEILEAIMRYDTKYFGKVEAEEKDLITFDQPMFGFENNTKYLFMMDESLDGSFIWLQSAEDPDLCFVLANPCLLGTEYDPKFSENISDIIGRGTYEMWLVMVISNDFSQSTVNLKSPVIVNLDERRAAQMISEDNFSMKYKLFENIKEDGK